jgi:hypothetical protein
MNDKFKKIVLNYLNDNYSDLISYDLKSDNDYVVFSNETNKTIFEYQKSTKILFVHYKPLWAMLYNLFGLDGTQIQIVTKEWFQTKFNLGVYYSNVRFNSIQISIHG